VFGSYLLGLKKTYEERIEAEAKAEAERQAELLKQQLHAERKSIALPFYSFWNEHEKTLNFGELSAIEFNCIMERIKNAKANHDAQVEAQRAENERLKREAEEKQQRRADRAKLLSPYIVFIRDYNGLLDKDDSEFNAEFQNIKIGAEQQWEHEREQAAKAKKEQEEARIAAEKAEQHRANLEAELKAKQDAEIKAEQERLAALEAELSKGDAETFDTLISDLTALKTKYQFKSAKYRKKLADVSELIDRIITHVKK